MASQTQVRLKQWQLESSQCVRELFGCCLLLVSNSSEHQSVQQAESCSNTWRQQGSLCLGLGLAQLHMDMEFININTSSATRTIKHWFCYVTPQVWERRWVRSGSTSTLTLTHIWDESPTTGQLFPSAHMLASDNHKVAPSLSV